MDEPIIATEEQPGNVLETLAAKRKAIAESKDAFIPLPGYSADPPILMAQYRLLTGSELNVIGQRVARTVKGGWERQLQAAVQTMIAACTGIYYDMEDGKGPQPLTLRGEPIAGFDAALAEALGFTDRVQDVNRPSDVVFALFGGNEVWSASTAFVSTAG